MSRAGEHKYRSADVYVSQPALALQSTDTRIVITGHGLGLPREMSPLAFDYPVSANDLALYVIIYNMDS